MTVEAATRRSTYVPAVTASLAVSGDTPVEPFDYEHPETTAYRVVGLRIEKLTLHIGTGLGDAEIVEVCKRLIGPLNGLRENAERRLSAPLPTADDVRGILA